MFLFEDEKFILDKIILFENEICPEEFRPRPKNRVLGEHKPLLKSWIDGFNLEICSGENELKQGLCCIYYINIFFNIIIFEFQFCLYLIHLNKKNN